MLKEPEKEKQKEKMTVFSPALLRLFPYQETEPRPSKLSPNLGIQHSRRSGMGRAGEGWETQTSLH